jgi:exosortase A-associated hydrolase 2
VEPFFLPAPGGQRLCIHHAPTGPARGAVLYVHPWAEEMNKSRRMAALQSHGLASAGYAVLRLDLHGCGDSSGDFADASWSGWVDDVLQGARWLQQRYAGPLHLWGLRAGALLATQAASKLAQPCHFLFWQPALAGKQLLNQFLRLKAAANLQQGDAKTTMAEAREALAAGRPVDVAGYTLGPELAQGLESATLELPLRSAGVTWLELSTREPAALLPASADRVESWRAAGHRVHAEVVPGPAFWQTQEIEDAPQLLAATLAALQAHPETVAA